MSKRALQRIAENKKTKAKFLDLGNCGLTEVPEEVGELVWLKQLLLSNNENLIRLDHLAGLPEIVLLDCSNTQISDITPLAQLVKLELLYCYYTNLANLDPLSGLANLQLLYCSNTKIRSLTPLAGRSNLQFLYCSETQISDLTPIAEVTSLKSLKISSTKIVDLSPIVNLKNLEALDIWSTKISDLTPVSGLVRLKKFDASRTKIVDLTPLSSLINLEKLYFAYTGVTDLRPILKLINKGIPVKWEEDWMLPEHIFATDCPLTNPPPEVVKQGNAAILNYFREKDEQGTVKLCEAKMLLVGEGGAGKTSLLRRLYQKDKSLPEENESTKGIDIYRHEFQMPDGATFRLNVWDFGGQEIYHATHQFFLTKRSLYILLDDTRKDHKTVHDEGFKYWLEAIDLLSGHSPVLIFQNEKSGRTKQIDIAGIKGKFDNVKDVWSGNLELPGAADKIGEAIQHFAHNLPHIGEELPAKWVSIRSEIEQLAQIEPFINQAAYFDLYGRHLEFDRTKALFLSQYLHDLGVFLHFQDDPLLARTVILQNTWATEAVFKMLDDETVKGKLGRFTTEDCTRVWSGTEYAEMHPELLALMQKFELCYRLPDTRSDTWLVPQLLPPSKPKGLAHWAQPGDLGLRYRYQFMPKGLISRLMVRMHRFVPRPEMGWITGVLFEHMDAQVLVEIPPRGGEIVLRARGQERKSLLSVIASDLDALNDTFSGLQEKVRKWVPCNCKQCQTLTEPEFFEQKRLLQRKRDDKLLVECPGSYEKVSVLELLDGVKTDRLPDWARDEGDMVRQIHALIQARETRQALTLFHTARPNEATILLGQLADADQRFKLGILDQQELARFISEINYKILGLLDTTTLT